MQKLFLIDASGFIFRAFHALPPLRNPKGDPVGAVYGFCNMILKLLEEEKPEHIAVIFDSARHTFRQEIYPNYKAHRPETPEDLIPQFKPIREACSIFGLVSLELEGFEADDLIATYATKAAQEEMEVVIVSSDKDLMQLITDKITLYDPMKNKRITTKEVQEKFGVLPFQVIDVQALSGDSADNVPGVPGIGPKTASELILTYGSLENLYKNMDTLKESKRKESLVANKELAFISKKLVTLCDHTPLPYPISDLSLQPIDMAAQAEFLESNGFGRILKRLGHITETEAFKLIPPKIITTEADLEVAVKLIEKHQHFAVDTETTSLNTFVAKIVGISLCVKDYVAYIPTGHIFGKQLPLPIVLDYLKPVLEHPGILKIGQNLKYDRDVLANYNVDIVSYDDTLLLSYVLNGTKHSNSLDTLSDIYLNHKTIAYSDVCGAGKKQKSFAEVDIQAAATYSGEDAQVTYALWKVLKPLLTQNHGHTLYERIERPMVKVTSSMERQGILVDETILNTLGADFDARLKILEADIHTQAGEVFNIASPKQLGEILFHKLKLPEPKKTKTGNFVTDVDVLEELAEAGHVVPKLVHEWRGLAKLKSTYVDGLKQAINPKTKRVHTSFSTYSTNTGRFSSTNPNLQNIPVRSIDGKKIRSAFIASPGYTLLSLDYSQIELRLLAHMAQVDPLIKAFRANLDIHKATAAQVFQKSIDQVTSEDRQKAKAINFGIIYGISAFGLANQIHTSNSEAAEIIKTYMEQYPGIEIYMEEQKSFAKRYGYVETLFKRKCYTQGILDKSTSVRQFAERQAINAPLQGSNADLIKLAMSKIHNYLLDYNLKSHMLLTVHDELVFEIHESELQTLPQQLKKIMETLTFLSVPLVVDMSTGTHWGEL